MTPFVSEAAPTELIAPLWEEHWGLPIVTAKREYMPPDVEGLACRARNERTLGLVTWAGDGQRAEIVSPNALELGRGIGSRLMDAAEEELRRRGVWIAHLVTTNDNPRALSFYVRRDYRLVRVHLDAMHRVLRAKPQVPLTGKTASRCGTCGSCNVSCEVTLDGPATVGLQPHAINQLAHRLRWPAAVAGDVLL